MNLRPLQVLVIVLASMLLGVIITFSFLNISNLKLLTGSIVFSITLLLLLATQLHESSAEQ